MTERLTREARRERTRARLVEAACELFAERGIHGTSLDDVAARAGLTKGAVYSNFDSKDDLLMTIVSSPENLQANRDAVHTVSTMVTDGSPARVEELAAGLVNQGSRQSILILVEFWLYAMRNPPARAKFVEGLRLLQDAVTERIEAEMAGDEDPPVLPADLTILVSAFSLGFQLLHLADPERVPLEVLSSGYRMLLSSLLEVEEAGGGAAGGQAGRGPDGATAGSSATGPGVTPSSAAATGSTQSRAR